MALVSLSKMVAAGIAALALAASAAGLAPAFAQTAGAYTARGIAVDRTAATAAEAREAAFAEGRRLALRQVLERITPREAQARLPNPSDTQILDMMQSFEVESERRSAVRYIATLTVDFKPEAIRALLEGTNVTFTEAPARPLVVLPVLTESGRALLWEDPNPWRAAWGRLAPVGSLTPVVVPLGDLADVGAVSAEQAVAGDSGAIEAIAGRYSAAGALVANARLVAAEGRRPALQVSVQVRGESPGDRDFRETYTATANEDAEALMVRAAAEIRRAIEERWKRQAVVDLGREERLTVQVPLTRLEDLVAVQQRLSQLPAVRRGTLLSLSRDGASFELVYLGDPERLAVVLAQRDLRLARDGETWRMTVGAPGGGGGSPRP